MNSAVSTKIQNVASATKALALQNIYEQDNCTSIKYNRGGSIYLKYCRYQYIVIVSALYILVFSIYRHRIGDK